MLERSNSGSAGATSSVRNASCPAPTRSKLCVVNLLAFVNNLTQAVPCKSTTIFTEVEDVEMPAGHFFCSHCHSPPDTGVVGIFSFSLMVMLTSPKTI